MEIIIGLLWLLIPYILFIHHLNKSSLDLGVLGKAREIKKTIFYLCLYIASLIAIGILYKTKGNGYILFCIIASFIISIVSLLLIKIEDFLYDKETRKELELMEQVPKGIYKEGILFRFIKTLNKIMEKCNLYIIPPILYILCWICYFRI